jgi:hypothetical protein
MCQDFRDGHRQLTETESNVKGRKVKQTEAFARTTQRGNPSEEGEAMLRLTQKSTARVAPKQRNLHQA